MIRRFDEIETAFLVNEIGAKPGYLNEITIGTMIHIPPRSREQLSSNPEFQSPTMIESFLVTDIRKMPTNGTLVISFWGINQRTMLPQEVSMNHHTPVFLEASVANNEIDNRKYSSVL